MLAIQARKRRADGRWGAWKFFVGHESDSGPVFRKLAGGPTEESYPCRKFSLAMDAVGFVADHPETFGDDVQTRTVQVPSSYDIPWKSY